MRAARRGRSACVTCRAVRAAISAAVLTGTPDEQAGDIRAYAEAGLDELMLSMPWRSLDDLATSLRGSSATSSRGSDASRVNRVAS